MGPGDIRSNISRCDIEYLLRNTSLTWNKSPVTFIFLLYVPEDLSFEIWSYNGKVLIKSNLITAYLKTTSNR